MKKWILVTAISVVLFFGGLQIYVTMVQSASTKELEVRLARLPSMSLQSLDGSYFLLKTGLPLVLVYFNSECDHCRSQMNDIKANLNLYSGAVLVLMSSQDLEDVKAFATELDLGRGENIHFARIEPAQLSQSFGTLSLPQIFVYSAEGKLLRVFSGETDSKFIAP